MSSMAHKTLTLVALLAGAALAQPLAAQSTGSSPEFRTTMVAMQPGQIAQSIERWNYLRGQQNLDFSAYANFISAHPGFPQQAVLQQRAEAALDRDPVGPETLVAFFDRNPPLTNPAKARYALALAILGTLVVAMRAPWPGRWPAGTSRSDAFSPQWPRRLTARRSKRVPSAPSPPTPRWHRRTVPASPWCRDR